MLKFSITKEIANQFGNVTIGVLEAQVKPPADYSAIRKYTHEILANPPNTSPQIEKWIEIFKKMNAKTGRESSIVFLTRYLAEKGKLFNIHPVVDFYNAISIKYGLPMGAYDMDKIVGTLQLKHAKKGEEFVGINGKDIEKTSDGEVIYADEQGVTCRFWNDRDCDRTKITKATTRFAIFFDGIDDAGLIKSAQADMEKALKDFTCKSYIVSAKDCV